MAMSNAAWFERYHRWEAEAAQEAVDKGIMPASQLNNIRVDEIGGVRYKGDSPDVYHGYVRSWRNSKHYVPLDV